MLMNIPNISNYEANGQLGNPAGITKANEDLNNYKTAGVYVFAEAYTPKNIPEGVVNGWLIVLPWSVGETCKQVFLRHGTPNSTDFNCYVRINVSGTWGKWTELATERTQGLYNLKVADSGVLRYTTN